MEIRIVRIDHRYQLIITRDGKDVARYWVDDLKGFTEEQTGTICFLCGGLRRIP